MNCVCCNRRCKKKKKRKFGNSEMWMQEVKSWGSCGMGSMPGNHCGKLRPAEIESISMEGVYLLIHIQTEAELLPAIFSVRAFLPIIAVVGEKKHNTDVKCPNLEISYPWVIRICHWRFTYVKVPATTPQGKVDLLLERVRKFFQTDVIAIQSCIHEDTSTKMPTSLVHFVHQNIPPVAGGFLLM